MPTRESFERALQQLLDNVLVLGSMVEQAISQSMEALKNQDQQAAQRIYAEDRMVNEKRYAIENECITLIATQQPMARDLRFITAILEINTELERMGDYAKGISRIVQLIGKEPIIVSFDELNNMAEKSIAMLRRALDAFVRRDVSAAKLIPPEDDEVDEMYNLLYKHLIRIMLNDPQKVNHANHLMWAAHNLERMADRVTNICERIVYMVTGEMQELDHSDDELKMG